jgi:hypothetical protein
MNESIQGERTVSELQDRVTELIERQRAIVAKRTSKKWRMDARPLPVRLSGSVLRVNGGSYNG